ncbi:hypothetical protein ACVME8_008016 [Bradyrhizobium diazoefficiens]
MPVTNANKTTRAPTIDMKLEVVVIPVPTSIVPRSSMQTSDGGSMPISRGLMITA